MFVLCFIVAVLLSYFLGCFNGALIVSKYILHDDVRSHGSGNAGLTNFYRVFGGKLTAVVIICDLLKAVVAILIGMVLIGRYPGWLILSKYISGLACMLGHMFPCMFQLKGGKGVLSGLAIVCMMDWRIALIAVSLFVIAFALTRMVSLGSVLAAFSFIITSALLYRSLWITVFAFVIGGLIIWRHRSNIGRIIRGEESRFQFHKKTDSEEGTR